MVEGINQRVAALDEQWSTYLPEQHKYVQNNKVLTQGRYVFLIIGNEEVSAYAENVFLRKFDPTIEEMAIVRNVSFRSAPAMTAALPPAPCRAAYCAAVAAR